LANKIGKTLASYPAEIADDAIGEARVLEDGSTPPKDGDFVHPP
jgi:hypothetical protein